MEEFDPLEWRWDTLPPELAMLRGLPERWIRHRYVYDADELGKRKRPSFLRDVAPLLKDPAATSLRKWIEQWHCERWDDVVSTLHLLALYRSLAGDGFDVDREAVSASYARHFESLAPGLFAQARDKREPIAIEAYLPALSEPREAFLLSAWERVCAIGADQWSVAVAAVAAALRQAAVRRFLVHADGVFPAAGYCAAWTQTDAPTLQRDSVCAFIERYEMVAPGVHWCSDPYEALAELYLEERHRRRRVVGRVILDHLAYAPLFDAAAVRRHCLLWLQVCAHTCYDEFHYLWHRLIWVMSRTTTGALLEWARGEASISRRDPAEIQAVAGEVAPLVHDHAGWRL